MPDKTALERRQTTSIDGTALRYYVGGAPPGAPALLLAGGPLAPGAAWRAQLAYLGPRLRFLSWDARGLFGSAAANRGFAMSLQLADLRAVLDAERVERVALLGFSFGVQLALEAYRELGERVGCMVLMSGAPGRPLDALARSQTTGAALRRALQWARRKNGSLDKRLPRALLKPIVTRLVGPPAAAELREELIDALASSELSPLLGTLDGYAHHDAWGLLDEVRAPTLVIAGTRDPLAPLAVMQRLARHIPHSEVLVVRGAHHFSFAEYPDLVNLRLERFFEDVGWW